MKRISAEQGLWRIARVITRNPVSKPAVSCGLQLCWVCGRQSWHCLYCGHFRW